MQLELDLDDYKQQIDYIIDRYLGPLYRLRICCNTSYIPKTLTLRERVFEGPEVEWTTIKHLSEKEVQYLKDQYGIREW